MLVLTMFMLFAMVPMNAYANTVTYLDVVTSTHIITGNKMFNAYTKALNDDDKVEVWAEAHYYDNGKQMISYYADEDPNDPMFVNYAIINRQSTPRSDLTWAYVKSTHFLNGLPLSQYTYDGEPL